MKGTQPQPKHSTTSKRISRAVVGIGRTTRQAARQEVSDTRRAGVYKTDVDLFAAATRAPSTPFSETELRRIVELRDNSRLSWDKIAGVLNDENGTERSGSGVRGAYLRHRENGS